MNKNIIKTDKAPTAVGTYSQGVEVEGIYYFSGQIGLEPSSMKMQTGFEEELQQILKNMDGLLESQSLKRENIIKTTIFLIDLKQFEKVNIAYQKYFKTPYPARSCVEVSALPKGAQVEIEFIAHR